MPSIATNIVINDGKTTPVAHTFSADDRNGSLAKFANRAATLLEAMEQLWVSVLKPNSKAAAKQHQTDLVIPVTAVVDGKEQVIRTSKVRIIYSFAPDSLVSERKDLRTLVQNLHANAGYQTSIDNVESYW